MRSMKESNWFLTPSQPWRLCQGESSSRCVRACVSTRARYTMLCLCMEVLYSLYAFCCSCKARCAHPCLRDAAFTYCDDAFSYCDDAQGSWLYWSFFQKNNLSPYPLVTLPFSPSLPLCLSVFLSLSLSLSLSLVENLMLAYPPHHICHFESHITLFVWRSQNLLLLKESV